MFKSVLIAEDHEIANLSVKITLQELGIAYVKYAYFCDSALAQIKHRLSEGNPYELLITDLSFDDDGYPQVLSEGAALIVAARMVQPSLKILVFSAEHKTGVVRQLFQQHGINGYVRKARRDAQQLKIAINEIYENKQHIPQEFRQELRQRNAHDFSTYDMIIISQLAMGTLQKEIPDYLQQAGISPSGLSSIEKRLNHIREALNFTTNEQLIAYCKDQGLI